MVVWGWTGLERGRQHPHRVINPPLTRRPLERATEEGERPVGEKRRTRSGIREYGGTRDIPPEAGGTTLQG